MKVTLKIRRGVVDRQHWQEYQVEVEPTDRVLDALLKISASQDSTLKFRRSCAHGICGSDAMLINGKEKLACKCLFLHFLEDAAKEQDLYLTIEPLRNFPLIEDMLVDQEPFMEKLRSVKAYMDNKELPADGKEYYQSAEDHAIFEEATKCISCGSCYSACPIVKENPNFVGPAALVHGIRFLFDSRNQNKEKQMELLDRPNGVWACDNHFDCTRACPREIKITKLINESKRYIKKQKAAG